ncbi:hypothetical protein RDWZM_001483 [Blomia tropicalis]|uniref:Uncharacterized protein n=1 Tax=Blomia tropicalis TaxID=40697 RepID=A0A9Q0RP01_BLOTA|nr:hypothetical protein RDWZM_001483 [Blomia tropicalis]
MDFPLQTGSSLEDQITKYEHFIDVVLKGDLKRVSKEYEIICERVVEYMNIKTTIKTLIENKINEFKTMSDIGSNCYVKCVVPNSDMIYLDVGLNHFVQLKLEEALIFIEKRVELYNQTLETLSSK